MTRNEGDHDEVGDLTSSVPDFTTSIVRMLSGLAGPAGSILAEVVTVGIARQRHERLAEFLQRIVERLNRVEESAIRQRLSEPDRVELLEIGGLAAARAASEDRRRYVAEIVARGLTAEEAIADELKKYLNVLGDLTDQEIVWLIYRSELARLGPRSDFYTHHEETLRPASRDGAAPVRERERAALQEGYTRNLQRLGLLHDTGPGGANVVTDFGRLFLRHLGVWSQSDGGHA